MTFPGPAWVGESARFLLVGGSSFAAGMVVLVFLVEHCGVPTMLAWATLWVGTNFFTFLANKHFTFRRSGASFWRELWRYYGVMLSSGILSALLLFLAHDGLGIPLVPACAGITVGITAYNFLLHRGWTFGQRRAAFSSQHTE